MTQKYILSEYFSLCEGGICKDLLSENEKRYVSEGGMILSGVAQRADIQNGNGRVYPYKVLAREVENFKKLIQERRTAGELNHPDNASIDPNRVSHMITEIWWQNKDVYVKLKVLTGVPGQQLRSLVNDGVAIGLSSRGLGSVQDVGNGKLLVEDDFQLIAFDVVLEPSTAGAFMKLNESKNFKTNNINKIIDDILMKRK